MFFSESYVIIIVYVCTGRRWCTYHSADERDQQGAFFFPDILNSKEKKASELSCGDVNISAPQHFATNEQAALICFTDLINFIENERIIDGVSYFNVFENSIIRRTLNYYIEHSLKKYAVNDYLSLSKILKEQAYD